MTLLESGAAPQAAPGRDASAQAADRPYDEVYAHPERPVLDGARPKMSLLEKAVRGRLRALTKGSLTVRTAHGSERFGEAQGASTEGASHGIVDVHDDRFWSSLALRGSVGSGEGFAYGWWTSPEPTDVVRVFVSNIDALDGMERGLARLSLPFLKAYHAFRDNTRGGSRKNISAHYDLSNEFFGLFLDPTMTYSSAVFERPDMGLQEAQLAKIDRLCERLDVKETDHLLEIGTGWGAFAIRAAGKFGCRVTTTTISEQQHAFAKARIETAGLSDKINLRLEDYRDLTGTYDKIVSVEMIEAVGAKHYPAYFNSCAGLLKPGGALALQAITIHDRHFEKARKAVDFIQRHIFPGSCIPSVSALTDAARDASDFRLVHLEDIGHHYVPTLRIWRDALRAKRSEAQALGFDDDFLRLFDFYFAYCEGGFDERHISVSHMVYAREGRGFAPRIAGSLLPPL